MKKTSIYIFLFSFFVAALLATGCSSDSDALSVTPPPSPSTVKTTPISITANYDVNGSRMTRVEYAENGDDINATWQANDQIIVVFDGHMNTIDIKTGTGEATATFEGSIIGTPTTTSELICYVNNATVATIKEDGTYKYADDVFLTQDGTLAGAAKCNLYSCTTTFGTGNITCNFSVNTSMLKFSVWAPDGVVAGTTNATLTYKSNNTELAKATFTVGTAGENTIYMTVPAGTYTGNQELTYTSGNTTKTKTLSSTKAAFTAGHTYSKSVFFPDAIDLSNDKLESITVSNGKTITGVLKNKVKISIADGATVVLKDAEINGTDDSSCSWAGITCVGNATIILEGTNEVKGFSDSYPGIYVPSVKTLTIQGNGSLEASSNGYGAGIGAGFSQDYNDKNCGNINICGGNITATGGTQAAGIGGAGYASCGTINISGGTITAYGGKYCPGIGSGYYASCGDITITNTVTKVIATKGQNDDYQYYCSIGMGVFGSCGTVTIGGTIKPDGIDENPYTYPTSSN